MAEGAITVQATVAFDAFPSSKTSKWVFSISFTPLTNLSGCTPFALVLRDIPATRRNRKENMILCACVQHSSNLRPAVYEKIVDHLTNALLYPIKLRTGVGSTVEVFLRFVALSLDLEAVRSAFCFKGWQSYYGCPLCLAKTSKKTPKRFLYQRAKCEYARSRENLLDDHKIKARRKRGKANERRVYCILMEIYCILMEISLF